MGVDEDVQRVHDEFLSVLNDLAGTHAISVIGIIRAAQWIESDIAPGRGPNSLFFIGEGDPNTAAGYAYQRWPILSMSRRLDGDGPVVGDLGRQWVVMVASQWNDHFRRRYAEANGVPKNEFRDAGLADINRMRNDIVHHRGIASVANTGRCEIFRWFAPGETIHPMMAHVSEFMGHMGAQIQASEIDGDGPWRTIGGF